MSKKNVLSKDSIFGFLKKSEVVETPFRCEEIFHIRLQYATNTRRTLSSLFFGFLKENMLLINIFVVDVSEYDVFEVTFSSECGWSICPSPPAQFSNGN